MNQIWVSLVKFLANVMTFLREAIDWFRVCLAGCGDIEPDSEHTILFVEACH